MKNILILGGTNFIGRVLVEKMLEIPGCNITLYNRGKRNPNLFSNLNRIYNDREKDDFTEISAGNWDTVIDLSGYYPNSFERLIQACVNCVKRYVFISTISVFDLEDLKDEEITEDTPTLLCTEEQKKSVLPDAYGEKKAEMERILSSSSIPEKVVIRPSFVYGPYDFTDRFYYWMWRGRNRSDILVPSVFSNFSITEVNDLTDGIIRAIFADKPSEVYNAITHPKSTILQIIQSAQALSGNNPALISLSPNDEKETKFPLHAPFSFQVSDKKWKKELSIHSRETIITSQLYAYYENLGWPETKGGYTTEEEYDIIRNIR